MLEELKTTILEYVDVEPEEITPEARFIEDLHFNSYDFMSFLGELEEQLDVTIEEEDVLKLRTVGEAIAYLESLQQK
ncbi:acyl carrier protein [uncultured Ruminococcus sp.]|uniref:acyl carrier protein n=1 Tax=uncultured Ruminococcus sp. TaxID=165186 RepID=UPI0026258DA7|nr:acyl carrier protein [uncultured Ruminococcus sp.]